MDATLTTEQVEIRDAARRFLAECCPPAHARAMADDPRGYSPALWRQMAELGWLGLTVPEAHGGLGESFVDLCLLVEEQGRVLLPSPFLSTVVLASQAIARFGSGAQQREHLPAIVAGERVVAVAHGGWDPTDVGVTATRDQRGYTLTGAAELVDYAHAADLLLVCATVGDRAGGELAWFVIASDAAGVRAARIDTVDRGVACRVSFDGVHVAEDSVLGRPGAGRDIAGAVAGWGAAARCAEMVGLGQRVLDMTVEYAQQRVAFGTPIGAFQAVQHHCANMAVDVLASGGITREAVWRVAVGDEGAADSVSTAKAWVSDAIARVCALGHQVHGAIGFTAEHDLHLFSKRARAAELDFGDAAWHRGRVATSLGL